MGVLPLVLSTGAGAEMRQAMGVAVFAGMIGVTAFGLFLTPVFYVLLRRLTGNRPLKLHGEVPHLEAFARRAAGARGGGGGGASGRCRGAARMTTDGQENDIMKLASRPSSAAHALLPLLAALVLAGCATAPADAAGAADAPAAVQGRRRAAGRVDRAAGRSAGARRVVAGLRRPGARRAGRARRRATTPASRRRRRGWRRRAPLARSADADRAPQIGLGAGASRAGAAPDTATGADAGDADHGRRQPLVRARPVRPPRRRASDAAALDARVARGAAAEHAPAGAGRGGADLPRAARARRRARAGARHRRRPTATRCA